MKEELPILLWVDFLTGTELAGTISAAETYFKLVYCHEADKLDALIDEHKPAAICFDFDYPLESQLGIMQSTKRRNSSLPVVMLTVDHSEALAVWSFRARVWNYLVKPLPEQEWRSNLQVLSRIAAIGPRQRRELRLPGPAVAQLGKPNRAALAHQAVLPAIRYVEQHYNESFTAERMAALCEMSPFRFSREFRKALGNTFQDYVLRYRVSESCRLFKQRPQSSVADIGQAAGFTDSSYFARIFKRYMSIKPSEYMREQARMPTISGDSNPFPSDDENTLPPPGIPALRLR